MDTGDDIRGGKQLDELYREVGPRLLVYFTRRHGNLQTAEDLLQESFAAALRRPGQLAASPSPRAFLFVIGRNLSINVYRRTRPEMDLPEEIAAPEPDTGDPRIEVMQSAIAKLSSSLREVLELRLEQDLSYEEIAAVLEIPLGTVRSRLHHAVKRLRQSLVPSSSSTMKGIDYES